MEQPWLRYCKDFWCKVHTHLTSLAAVEKKVCAYVYIVYHSGECMVWSTFSLKPSTFCNSSLSKFKIKALSFPLKYELIYLKNRNVITRFLKPCWLFHIVLYYYRAGATHGIEGTHDIDLSKYMIRITYTTVFSVKHWILLCYMPLLLIYSNRAVKLRT